MPFFEEMVIQESIEIKTTPEKIFKFLTGIVDNESYKIWHKTSHVSFRWIKGKPWEAGSVMYAEEYLHGKLHKLTFKVIKIIKNQYIEYSPTSRLVRMYYPKNGFRIEPKGGYSLFTASGTIRVGWIIKFFFKKAMEKGLSSVRIHLKEEGENLKSVLESE